MVTGVSGSGKSSLAFDTLYAEGQRRYVESLSSYARQFLGRMAKPDVDFITGLPPAIAVEQKVKTRNSRSTVGTTTEIYDYLRKLYARIGKTISPISGEEVKKHQVADVLAYVEKQPLDSSFLLLAPLVNDELFTWSERLHTLLQQGFNRLMIGRRLVRIAEVMEEVLKDLEKEVLRLNQLAGNEKDWFKYSPFAGGHEFCWDDKPLKILAEDIQ